MKFCKECGAVIEFDHGDGLCSDCHRSNSNKTYCGHCGSLVSNDINICPKCGCYINGNNVQNSTSTSTQTASYSSSNGLSDTQKKIIAFAVVILAGLLAAFWFFVESYDPTSGYEEEQKLKQEEIERLSPLTDDLSKSTEELEKKAEELLAEAGSMDY